jgi:hypothetical protein
MLKFGNRRLTRQCSVRSLTGVACAWTSTAAAAAAAEKTFWRHPCVSFARRFGTAGQTMVAHKIDGTAIAK